MPPKSYCSLIRLKQHGFCAIFFVLYISILCVMPLYVVVFRTLFHACTYN